MKLLLRLIGLLGAVLFGTAFVFSIAAPTWVEDAARDFIRRQIEVEVRAKLHEVRLGRVAEMAGVLARQHEAEIASLRQSLENGLPEKIAAEVARMRDLSCECRRKFAADMRGSMAERIVALSHARERLTDLIHEKYVNIVDKLRRELRIFSGVNTLVFLILLAISFAKPQATAQLFVPGLLLIVATAITSYLYLFQQNWLFTILYNDYIGFGYLAYLTAAFVFLCDVALNRAKATTIIVSTVLGAIGSVASVSPC